MKLIKGLLFLLVVILLGSCFDPPQFPSTPQIEYNNIVFIPGTGPGGFDSLVLTINFKDGDGDLGIDQNDLTYISDPFNSTFFFQENNGHLDTISTFIGTSADIQYHILEIDPNAGKLATIDTRKDPQYSYLPPDDCASYETSADRSTPDKQSSGRKILIPSYAANLLEANTKIVDTLSGGNQTFYQIYDKFLIQSNPNSYNIQVDFLVYDPTDPNADAEGYALYDIRAEFCEDFSGRFPVLSSNNNSLEGTLTYAMNSIGFRAKFSIKSLKLRVQIKDRALHKSNVIETPAFTLDKIRKG